MKAEGRQTWWSTESLGELREVWCELELGAGLGAWLLSQRNGRLSSGRLTLPDLLSEKLTLAEVRQAGDLVGGFLFSSR